MLCVSRSQLGLRLSAFPVARAAFSSTVLAFKSAPAKKVKTQETPKKAKLPYKRSVNAYALFNKEYHASHQEELKGVGIAERSKKLSSIWNNLDSTEKQKYYSAEEADKARYFEEKAAYEKTLPPKRPVTSYIRFYNEIRPKLSAENPTASVSDLGRLAGERWRGLSDAEKAQYKDASAKELEAWKEAYGPKK